MLFCVRADCSWCTGPLPCSASDAACVQPPPSCPCLSSRFSFAFFQAAHSVCEQLFSIIFLSEVYLSQEYFNGRATTLSATNNIHVTECNTQNLFCAEQVQNEPLKLFITKAFIKINLVISSDMPKSVRISLWALTSGRFYMLSNWFLPRLLLPAAKSWVRQKSVWVRPVER